MPAGCPVSATPTRRSALAQGLALLATAAQGQPADPAPAQSGPLVVGVPPFLTPAGMLAAFTPLRQHLERRLRRQVEIYTARDFTELIDQARRGTYELNVLPAHLGILAAMSWGFTPLAGSLATTKVLIVVRGQGPVRSAAELRGGRIGTLGPLSLTAAIGMLWLQQQQLLPGRDVEVLSQRSINSAMLSLERGELRAVVASRSQLDALPAGAAEGYSVLRELSDIPGPLYLGRPGASTDSIESLRRALLSFQPDPGLPITAASSAIEPWSPSLAKRLEPLREIALAQWQAHSRSSEAG